MKKEKIHTIKELRVEKKIKIEDIKLFIYILQHQNNKH